MAAVNDETISRAFDAGSYANAYETEDIDRAIASLSPNREPEYVAAFTLGFFGSYEMHEMGDIASEMFREAYRSPAGQRCLALGFMDAREWFMGEALGAVTLGMYDRQDRSGFPVAFPHSLLTRL